MNPNTLLSQRTDFLFRSDAFDLDAYFRRVGYSGNGTATLETLRELQFRHPEAIAYENLDALLGRAISLEASALERKLVQSDRGGHAFEHNILFGNVLHHLGFSIRGLCARGRFQVPADRPTGRDHMLLLVEMPDGPYIVDVGFNGLGPTAPLRLMPDVVQATPREEYRLLPFGTALELQVRLGNHWQALYQFDLSPQVQADFEVINYYMSSHPHSNLTNALHVGRVDGATRYRLHNSLLAVHLRDGTIKQRKLEHAGAILATLKEVFRIAVPDDPALLSRLAQFCDPYDATVG